MLDGGDDDAVLGVEVGREPGGVEAGRRHVAYRAALCRIEAGEDPGLGMVGQAAHPAIAQVAQPRDLPLDANRVVIDAGLGDRVVVRRRVRPDLLELPDVGRLAPGCGRERPQIGNPLAPHVQEAGPDRGEQPLVEARAVVVAAQVTDREREVSERVRPVDDGLDATISGQFCRCPPRGRFAR